MYWRVPTMRRKFATLEEAKSAINRKPQRVQRYAVSRARNKAGNKVGHGRGRKPATFTLQKMSDYGERLETRVCRFKTVETPNDPDTVRRKVVVCGKKRLHKRKRKR